MVLKLLWLHSRIRSRYNDKTLILVSEGYPTESFFHSDITYIQNRLMALHCMVVALKLRETVHYTFTFF